jgi:hypothetical protein
MTGLMSVWADGSLKVRSFSRATVTFETVHGSGEFPSMNLTGKVSPRP